MRLLVEGEPRLAAALRRGLEEEGYVVDNAPDAVQADEMAALVLHTKEDDLLRALLRSPETILSRTVIAERVWGDAQAAMGADGPETETVRGVGYRLVARV